MNITRISLAGVLGMLVLATNSFPADPGASPSSSADEARLWKLERDYWSYIQANDLAAYLGLWHENFLGWPASSPAPVGKDHITDGITAQTGKGLSIKPGELKPAGIRVTGNIASVCYRMTYVVADKQGGKSTVTLRVTHAWIRAGSGWQIISGMSMREPPPAAKQP